MAENMSPNVQLNDISQENLILSKSQDEHEVPLTLPGSSTDEEFPFLTPEPKLASQKHDYYTSELYRSSINEGSDISSKEGSEKFTSSSSSDTESSTYDHQINRDEDLQPKVIDFDIDSNVKEEKKDEVNEELLEKLANYKVELDSTKKKLQISQEEIVRLKYENSTLVEELGKTIENLRKSEENMSKMEQDLKNEFKQQLDFANLSVDLLQNELDSEKRVISELQEMINKTTNDLNNYGREVEELKLSLQDSQQEFSRERLLFQQEIRHLNEEKFGFELRNEAFEEQIKQYEIEKIEALKLHQARETDLLKSPDTNKLKYDMLMAEKDEFYAKMQTLTAELDSKNTNVIQMEEQIAKLSSENIDLLNELENTKKVVKELRLKGLNQEMEVEKQRTAILDSGNEKREAIRQLCFALEYYRNEYHVLRQVFIKNKQSLLGA